jgi:hypothetical protein
MQVRLVPKQGLGVGPGGLIDALAPAARPRTVRAVTTAIESLFFTGFTSSVLAMKRSVPAQSIRNQERIKSNEARHALDGAVHTYRVDDQSLRCADICSVMTFERSMIVCKA